MDQNLVIETPIMALATWGVLRVAKYYNVPTRYFPVIANIVSLALATGVATQTGSSWEVIVAQTIGGGALAVWGDNVKDRAVLGKTYQRVDGE